MSTISFLSLPGEIRNQIYNYLLILPSLSTPRLLGDPPLHPEVLLLNYLIHSEACEILYGSNTFLAHPSLLNSLPRLRLYYDPIYSPSLISLIRKYHIRVRLDCDPNFSAEKAKEAFSGVEELTIEVFEAQYGSSGYKVLSLFEGVRGVKKARIYGSIATFPEHVEWLQCSIMSPENEESHSFEVDSPVREAPRVYDT